ncbi:hypothetical protein CTAYLR_010482 [Chrysophaeum taylorii]|uniref:Ankyrin repeat protein n=1 Tax=Chrysophaeum taylorii TaxID=2483200 RepID=A0AAD7ULD6_9STRA|nr:hypothetical protein CTAYLR_010482 [Chrysophaeum taylorii]
MVDRDEEWLFWTASPMRPSQRRRRARSVFAGARVAKRCIVPGTVEELKEFAEVGATDWIEFVLARHRSLRSRVCEVAAGAGKIEVLKWARDRRDCPCIERACSLAARGGQLAALEWLRASLGCGYVRLGSRKRPFRNP